MNRTRQSVERELAQQCANLNHIEEKIATYTLLEAPVHLLNQRDQIRNRIAQLEEWLRTGQLLDEAVEAKSKVTVGEGEVRQKVDMVKRKSTGRFWIFIISMLIIVAFIVIAKVLLPQLSCQTPISANQVLIRPKQDVELVPYRGFHATGARGIVRNHGGIELGGLAPGNRYYLTLNGRRGIPPNGELCKINCKIGMGYWDFMTVTTNSNGEVSNQTLIAYLPGNVELCPNQVYSAKFFVKEAEPEYEVVLANDDFLFTLEALSSSIPQQLQITISNEVAKDYVKNVSMEVTEASSPLSPTTIKGDSPVTITVQVLDERQNVIPSDELIYSWDLCCPESIPPSNPHQSVWRFQPPTYLPTETLTITVSNRMGYSISAVIPFTITEQ